MNRCRFSGNSNFYGPPNMNCQNLMPRNPFGFNAPPRMMRHERPQFQRYPAPAPRGPPSMMERPFQRPNERNAFFRNEPLYSRPRFPPPNSMAPEQFYRGPMGPDNYGPRMRMSDYPMERYFVPWNSKPWDGKCSAVQNQMSKANSSATPLDKPRTPAKKTKKKRKKMSFRRKQKKQPMKPWMTEEIYNEVMKKNELYVKAKNSDKEELWQEFRAVRNKVSGIIKDAKIKAGILVKRTKEDDSIPRPHFCDNCDRAYATEEELVEHIKEHVKCDEEACSFEAHPKIIVFHKRMQHETGFATVIQNSSKPEDWINERKRRFPTLEMIKRKQEENSEKIARGEVIETKEFGKFKKRKLDPRFSQKPRGRRTRENRQSRKRQIIKTEVFSVSDDEEENSHILLPCFKGMQKTSNTSNCVGLELPLHDNTNNLNDSCVNSVIENNETDEVNVKSQDNCSSENKIIHPCENTNNQMNRASSSLLPSSTLMNCRISEDSDDEAPSILPISKTEIINYPVKEEKIIVEEKPVEEKRIFHSKNSEPQKLPIQSQNNSLKNHCNLPNKNNLLEKLLAKEISHERNVIFQCVRYVVKNNYFDVHTD